MKSCSLCHLELEEYFFHKKSSSKDGLYPYCKKCVKSKNLIHYSENKDSHKVLTYSWREKNKDKHCLYTENWRKSNPHKHSAKQARRRATQLNATPKWANKNLIDKIYHLASNKKVITGIDWEVDHIVPLQGKDVCGLHVEYNLQIIQSSDNRKKSNKFNSNNLKLTYMKEY